MKKSKRFLLLKNVTGTQFLLVLHGAASSTKTLSKSQEYWSAFQFSSLSCYFCHWDSEAHKGMTVNISSNAQKDFRPGPKAASLSEATVSSAPLRCSTALQSCRLQEVISAFIRAFVCSHPQKPSWANCLLIQKVHGRSLQKWRPHWTRLEVFADQLVHNPVFLSHQIRGLLWEALQDLLVHLITEM